MKFERLRVEGLRCLEAVSITPGPGLNVFMGRNGAGKTSLLEAAYLLSYGRSFRAGSRDALVRRGAPAMHVYGEIRDAAGHLYRLGLGREGGSWQIRINGDRAGRISDLVRFCAVVCFEPGSHALIAGPAEERRRFLDWGVFHVERSFLDVWQHYRRALKQRNALLRSTDRPGEGSMDPWERQMALAGQRVDDLRRQYLALLEPVLHEVCRRLLPELGSVSVEYRRGWDDGVSLAEALAGQRDRDHARGYTSTGIHRADWRIIFREAPRREHLSRGQEKLCALACLLAQARVYADRHEEWPAICLDDLGSELDAPHQRAVVEQLLRAGAQVWITGTDTIPALPADQARMFHVEHGTVTPMEDPSGTP